MKKISVFLSAVLMGMLVMVPVNAVNDYFTHSDRMASGAKVRAEQFNNVFDSIVTGLDKLPSQVQNNRGTRNYATATNVGNAYSATLSHVSGSYNAGQEVVFVASATNTGASTLNVSGIGASAIVNKDGSAIAAGVIQNNAMVHVRYNTTLSSWELMGAYILSSGVSVSAFASTLLDDADAAAMLVTLGSTPGTVTASDAVVVDANKDATGFRKITGATSAGFAADFTYTGIVDETAAIIGRANGTTGNTYAIVGNNASATGKGVQGYASHATGVNYGGYFSSDSSAGHGVYAATTVAGGIPISAHSVDVADSNPTVRAVKGGYQLHLNPRLPNLGWNPIVGAGDQGVIAFGAAGAIDTGVLTLAPYATNAVGIRIDSTDDTVAISGNASLSGSLDVSASGAGQIAFPATQNASAGANTLDDYEEGTWTPTLSGTTTYNTNGQVGYYIKIGKMVTASGWLNINTIGTGTTYQIGGLPFISATGATYDNSPATIGFFNGLTTSVSSVIGTVGSGSTSVTLYYVPAGGATGSSGPASLLGNGSRIAFTVTYMAAN